MGRGSTGRSVLLLYHVVCSADSHRHCISKTRRKNNAIKLRAGQAIVGTTNRRYRRAGAGSACVLGYVICRVDSLCKGGGERQCRGGRHVLLLIAKFLRRRAITSIARVVLEHRASDRPGAIDSDVIRFIEILTSHDVLQICGVS